MFQGDEDIYRALQAGAATYLLKDTLSDDLIRVIREVHAGKHPVQRRRWRRAWPSAPPQPTLTPREVAGRRR